MKTRNQILLSIYFTLWFLASITACSTKNLKTQSSRISNRLAEDITLHNLKRDSLQNSRIIELRDSVNKLYSIRIFPIDTFTFSIKDGYRGKAAIIEVMGTDQQVRRILDSSNSTVRLQNETQYDGRRRSLQTSESGAKELEKRSSGITGVLMLLVFIGVVLWLLWVFRRISIRF